MESARRTMLLGSEATLLTDAESSWQVMERREQLLHSPVLLVAATGTSTDEKSRPSASALRLLQMVPN
ncbi:hypothetical protein ACFXTO_046030 [Malus domestica]